MQIFKLRRHVLQVQPQRFFCLVQVALRQGGCQDCHDVRVFEYRGWMIWSRGFEKGLGDQAIQNRQGPAQVLCALVHTVRKELGLPSHAFGLVWAE